MRKCLAYACPLPKGLYATIPYTFPKVGGVLHWSSQHDSLPLRWQAGHPISITSPVLHKTQWNYLTITWPNQQVLGVELCDKLHYNIALTASKSYLKFIVFLLELPQADFTGFTACSDLPSSTSLTCLRDLVWRRLPTPEHHRHDHLYWGHRAVWKY